MAQALDQDDRRSAILAWLPWAGVLVWFVHRDQPDSLARRHGLVATVVSIVDAVVFFPLVLWSFAFGGTQATFLAVWIPMSVVSAIVIAGGMISAVRSKPRHVDLGAR